MDEEAQVAVNEDNDYNPTNLDDLEDGKTRYLVEDGDGEFSIDVPSSWKVTYGKLHGTPGNRGYGDREGNVLRLYESKEKQRAVFLNVKRFRDMSIPLRRRVIRVDRREERANDGQGHARVNIVDNRRGDWLD